MTKFLVVLLLFSGMAAAQQIPAPDELPGQPFFIKNTWTIGGDGPWDLMATDPAGAQLFIAHGPQVQVVDTATGSVSGAVTGLNGAHSVALDDTGQFGYVTDGPAGKVRVFDRRTFAIVASIPTGPSPRAIVFEPSSRLLFVVSSAALPPQSPAGAQNGPARTQGARSAIAVIDPQTRTVAGTILLPGRLGAAQCGTEGEIYVSIVDRNEVARLDAQALALRLHGQEGQTAGAVWPAAVVSAAVLPAEAAGGARLLTAAEETAKPGPQIVDLSALPHPPQSSTSAVQFFALGQACREPHGMALDAQHQRLFAACANMSLEVLDSAQGTQVAIVPVGPGADVVGYDADRGLIFTANGGGDGSLTIVRQHVTDTYSVIQTLPTRLRAHTLAVNPVSGLVYLVTDTLGVDVREPGKIGGLKMIPAEGTFQVLVVGN